MDPVELPGELAPTAGDVVPRPALVSRLVAGRTASLTALVAPAGYGKTTLLREWDAYDPRPFAWVRLCRSDDEPLELARAIAEGVAAAVPELREGLETIVAGRRGRASDARARRLAAVLAGAPDPFVLILDSAHVLHSSESFALIEQLVEACESHVQIAVASRQQPGLAVSRLRTERRLFELRTADLVLARAEIKAVAAASGLRLGERGCDLLAQRTEGWAAGVYLAILAVRDEPDPERALESFSGGDRLVVDYMRDEVLAQLPPPLVEFLARSSIAGRLSGPLCDHVLGRSDSASLLRDLSRRNVLVVPLDRTDTEYRYHALLAEALRSELRMREPELEPELHRRASDWYEQHGERGLAIDHALRGADLKHAGNLLWDAVPELLGYGQTSGLSRWLSSFSHEQIAGSAPLALTAAATQLALGDRALADHWVAIADDALGTEPPDPAIGAGLQVMRALACAADVDVARNEAALAYELACDRNQWRPLACLIEGMALRLGGDAAAARVRLDEGARRGVAHAPAVQVLCLAQLALLAIDEGDWECAAARTGFARAQIERVGLQDFPMAALVHATSAAVNAHMSRPDAADRDARQADRLLAQLAGFTPWYTAQCRIALAWASLRLGELSRARHLLAEAAADLRECPQATAARVSLRACEEQIEVASAARTDDAEELTTAELRVLQYLPTHLSFPEIADQLYVSRNTVKTHVRAVYRKLMASSRSEAVENARQAGMLDTAAM